MTINLQEVKPPSATLPVGDVSDRLVASRCEGASDAAQVRPCGLALVQTEIAVVVMTLFSLFTSIDMARIIVLLIFTNGNGSVFLAINFVYG